MTQLRLHSSYGLLLAVYGDARTIWRESKEIRQAAATWGWDEREYCDRYLHNVLGSWSNITSSSTADAVDVLPITVAHCDLAFSDAGERSTP